MTRYVQHRRIQRANLEAITIVEEVVELAAVSLKLCAGVEDLAKHFLDANDLVPDGKPSANFGLE